MSSTTSQSLNHSSLKWNSSQPVQFIPLYHQVFSVQKHSLTNSQVFCISKSRPQCLKSLRKSKERDNKPRSNWTSSVLESPALMPKWSITPGRVSAVSWEFISTQSTVSRTQITTTIPSARKLDKSSMNCTRKNSTKRPLRIFQTKTLKEPWSTSPVTLQFQVSPQSMLS